MSIQWENIMVIGTHSFVCGHCGSDIATEKGFKSGNNSAKIYICHKCTEPNYFNTSGNQTLGSKFGDDVSDIDDSLVEKLYDEARKCMSVSAYTAAVLSCRKLLMHIAVSKGADKGKKFIEYVEYLSDNNYVPPGAKGWVDHIREKGNEANHEIVLMEEGDAKELISFIGMLLKIIFEFPAKVVKKSNNT